MSAGAGTGILEPTIFSYDDLMEQGAIPVRKAGLGTNIIFEYNAHEEKEPLMREIGRQREITFRHAGGGTGKEHDIDQFDTGENAYTQLFVWNPELRVILGGYRYIKFKDIKGNLEENLASAHLFEFSERFKEDYAPSISELGRSYVLIGHQATKDNSNSRYILKNLWDGLGSITARDQDIKYFFGKVTMYPNNTYPGTRDLMLHYLHKHFEDQEGLIMPKHQQPASTSDDELRRMLRGTTFQEDYRDLKRIVNGFRQEHPHYTDGIPPLLNSYLNLTPGKLRVFGSANNDEFGNVEEIGIMIRIADINDGSREEYIDSYHTHKLPARNAQDA